MQKYEMSRRQVFGTRKIITGGQSRCGHRDTRAQLPPQALTTRLTHLPLSRVSRINHTSVAIKPRLFK